MLYSRDGIIKDSSLITIERGGKIIHNPSKSLLESEGWVEFSGDFSQFINKRFIKMTSDVLEGFDKEELVDTIVFLTDNNKLYLNGQYFGGEDIVVSYDEYGDNNTYVGEVNINGNSFEIGVPDVYYNSYTSGTNIGQLVVGDSSYDVYAPQADVYYESNQENGLLIGRLYVNGNEYPIYTEKSQEIPILSEKVTIDELNSLISAKKLNPGQKYIVTDYRTTVDENIGEAVYQENEKHELIFTALNNSELDMDVTSLQTFKSSSETVGGLEPTGDFELIAYKCDWDPDNSCYTEDDEYYKYVGETLNIDGETYYIWNKYENGIRLGRDFGKATIATTSLDFECSIDNPYHIEYFINYDEINDNYQFEEPSEDNGNDPSISDSLCRVVRIDKPVYNYYVKMQACDWDKDNDEYGYDEDSWYEYNGDTIDIDGVTYFKWNKYDNGGSKVDNTCYPLTDTLYIDCSPENPYTPEMWVSVDGELDNEYFDEFKTDIFYQVEDSNLPNLTTTVETIEDRKPVITKVHADLNITKNFDESQVVNAVAFKTKIDSETNYSYPDYEGLYLYHGETMDIEGDSYRVWDKYSNEYGEGFISIDYRKENDYFWAQILTKDLYIDCSLDKPYVQDYIITGESEEPVQNYEMGHDKIIEITYFNNVTNYIRFENNGWYVRCPELDRDGKFGWGYIDPQVLSEDGNGYNWRCQSEGNWAGPIPAFVNKYNFNDDNFFLTDTLDPQVGDSFYRVGNEDEGLDTIDKVWGTIIKPEIHYKGIYHMKDEFGNEAPYDFKHIKFNNLYTFGNEEEDYSLNGFENGVYNNVIMKPVDSNYNRMNISSKNTYGNTFYPSCRDCVIDFSIQESIITKSDRGLHPFCPTNFVEPIVVKDMLNPLKIITYTTTDEQIVNPKTDAFGEANIISNKYE